MTISQFDQAKAETFGGQMLNVLNGGMLGLMTSIGHRTGLFDTLATLPPATSQQIADAAGLNERYVREWLGAMVVGRIVAYDPAQRTYAFPPEHAASLTRAAESNNLAVLSQYLAQFGKVEDQVVGCFRDGGGVPYTAYPHFQCLQAEESRMLYDATLLDTTLPRIPGLVERLHAGIEILDIGCGRGHTLNLLAQAFPHSRFTGYDFSEEGVAAGQAEAAQRGLSNVRFAVKNIAALDGVSQYDLVTAFDVIHDLARPAQALRSIDDALRPDGIFLMVELAASSNLEENIDHPLAPALYAVSVMHCMTVSLAQGGEGLGAVWGEQLARQLLADAGFTAVETMQVAGDMLNCYFVARKR